MRRKPFSLRKQALEFVASTVHSLVILPRLETLRAGWNHWKEAEVQGQLQGFIVFVSAIHDPMQERGQGADTTQPFAALDGVGGLSRGKGEGYGRSSICGNHMNLGGPSAPRLADGR